MSSAKQTSLNQNQVTALHLYDVAHTLPLNPLNKQFSFKFSDFLVQKSINLPPNPTLTHKFCRKCGVIWIPGLTLSFRIVYIKKTKSKKSKEKVMRENSTADSQIKPKRKLRYRCLQCRNVEYDDTLIQRNEKRISQTKGSSNEIIIGNSNSVSSSNTPEPFRAEWSALTNTNEVSKDIKIKSNNNNSRSNSNGTNPNNKSKERSKKRKQNSLSSMLQQKKQQKEQESKTNSLNLMEFMQG